MAAPATAAAGASAASLPADTTASRRRRSVLLQNIPGSAEEAEAESHHKHPGDVAAKREDQAAHEETLAQAAKEQRVINKQLLEKMARHAMRKFPLERTDDDLTNIFKFLMAHQELRDSLVLSGAAADMDNHARVVCRAVTLLKVTNGSIVYKQGQQGDHVYIVLHGAVTIMHRPCGTPEGIVQPPDPTKLLEKREAQARARAKKKAKAREAADDAVPLSPQQKAAKIDTAAAAAFGSDDSSSEEEQGEGDEVADNATRAAKSGLPIIPDAELPDSFLSADGAAVPLTRKTSRVAHVDQALRMGNWVGTLKTGQMFGEIYKHGDMRGETAIAYEDSSRLDEVMRRVEAAETDPTAPMTAGTAASGAGSAGASPSPPGSPSGDDGSGVTELLQIDAEGFHSGAKKRSQTEARKRDLAMQNAIKACHVFSDWPQGEVDVFAEWCTLLDVEKGKPVYLKGDAIHSVYLLMSGSVSLTIESPARAGSVFALEHVHTPGYFGESEIIERVAAREVNATALEKCRIVEIPVHIFQQFVRSVRATAAFKAHKRVHRRLMDRHQWYNIRINGLRGGTATEATGTAVDSPVTLDPGSEVVSASPGGTGGDSAVDTPPPAAPKKSPEQLTEDELPYAFLLPIQSRFIADAASGSKAVASDTASSGGVGAMAGAYAQYTHLPPSLARRSIADRGMELLASIRHVAEDGEDDTQITPAPTVDVDGEDWNAVAVLNPTSALGKETAAERTKRLKQAHRAAKDIQATYVGVRRVKNYIVTRKARQELGSRRDEHDEALRQEVIDGIFRKPARSETDAAAAAAAMQALEEEEARRNAPVSGGLEATPAHRRKASNAVAHALGLDAAAEAAAAAEASGEGATASPDADQEKRMRRRRSIERLKAGVSVVRSVGVPGAARRRRSAAMSGKAMSLLSDPRYAPGNSPKTPGAHAQFASLDAAMVNSGLLNDDELEAVSGDLLTAGSKKRLGKAAAKYAVKGGDVRPGHGGGSAIGGMQLSPPPMSFQLGTSGAVSTTAVGSSARVGASRRSGAGAGASSGSRRGSASRTIDQARAEAAAADAAGASGESGADTSPQKRTSTTRKLPAVAHQSRRRSSQKAAIPHFKRKSGADAGQPPVVAMAVAADGGATAGGGAPALSPIKT